MVADVFSLPVQVPAETEGAAFGAALQALWACHTPGGPADLADIARTHVVTDPALSAQPDRGTASGYGRAYEQFLRHLEAAKSLYSPA